MANGEHNRQLWIALGSVIRRLRKINGISQEQLALRAEVDRRYLSDVEQGKRNLSLGVISKIALFFDIPISSLMMMVEQEMSPVFKSIDNLKDYLCSRGYEDSVVLENPDFLSAVVGISEDGRIVYSFSKMALCLVEDGMNHEDAIDFIEYNTIRSLPYMGKEAPVIIYDIQ